MAKTFTTVITPRATHIFPLFQICTKRKVVSFYIFTQLFFARAALEVVMIECFEYNFASGALFQVMTINNTFIAYIRIRAVNGRVAKIALLHFPFSSSHSAQRPKRDKVTTPQGQLSIHDPIFSIVSCLISEHFLQRCV